MSVDSFRLAVAQPRTLADPPANVSRAVELIADAAAQGAALVLFPEHSPGPHRPGQDYDPTEAMADAAIQYGIAVCWSRNELCADGCWRLVVYVTDRDGQQVVRYERSHPATLPPGQTGAWIAPGPRLCSFELEGVHVGIIVCSELWVPEPTRVLAIRGAELILSPAGGRFTSLTENWKLVARVRAIENLCHVAVTNNLIGEESGAAMIAGPEHPLVVAGREELIVATLDLARARWLRDTDDSMAEPKPFDSIPGLVRARRPELYPELTAPAADLFDYAKPPTEPVTA